jgi:hypothetical protein
MPSQTDTIKFIDTRPETSVLSVFRHLNYKHWNALAEYVDNSLQSYLMNRDRLYSDFNQQYVTISISFDNEDNAIVIKDNAAGISLKDFPRAFRPASVPPDTSSLSEFGLGMKTASCWAAPLWSVRTKALDENYVRTVIFDIDEITENKQDDVPVISELCDKAEHFTVVTLNNVFRMPKGVTIKKIKDHLSDIYRVFIRNRSLKLLVNNELLVYEEPIFLSAPYHNDPADAPVQYWKRDIDVVTNGGKIINGFVGILETGGVSKAGLTLFRRGRAILGSGDDRYKPMEIFTAPNSFKSQRIYGELHLDEFSVTQQKDAFTWREFSSGEVEFIEIIKQKLSSPPSFLTQAERHRQNKSKIEIPQEDLDKILEETANAISKGLPTIVDAPESEQELATPPVILPPIQLIDLKSFREFNVLVNDQSWHIRLEISSDSSIVDWLTISDRPSASAIKNIRNEAIRSLGLRISLRCPFMVQFLGPDMENLEPLFRLAVALGLSQVIAAESGVVMAGVITKKVNELLKGPLAKGDLND